MWDSRRCDELLRRALGQLRPLPHAPTLLGDCLAAPSVLSNPTLAWSPGEPAVNVYSKGGEFKPHEDEQTLTVLMPLTSQAAPTPSTLDPRTLDPHQCCCRGPLGARRARAASRAEARPSGLRGSGGRRTRADSAA